MMKLQQKVAKLAAELKYAKEDLAKHKALMAEKKRTPAAATVKKVSKPVRGPESGAPAAERLALEQRRAERSKRISKGIR
jgi:hypothetical protein